MMKLDAPVKEQAVQCIQLQQLYYIEEWKGEDGSMAQTDWGTEILSRVRQEHS